MERITKKELERRVDEVLFYKWDPVGINHHIMARAEYRSYVPSVLAAVNTGAHNAIVSLLIDIQTNKMGCSVADSSVITKIAELLLEHKEAIDNRHA